MPAGPSTARYFSTTKAGTILAKVWTARYKELAKTMPGLDESDDIIPVIDVLVPDEILEGSAEFRAITAQARTSFDEFIKAMMPSED